MVRSALEEKEFYSLCSITSIAGTSPPIHASTTKGTAIWRKTSEQTKKVDVLQNLSTTKQTLRQIPSFETQITTFPGASQARTSSPHALGWIYGSVWIQSVCCRPRIRSTLLGIPSFPLYLPRILPRRASSRDRMRRIDLRLERGTRSIFLSSVRKAKFSNLLVALLIRDVRLASHLGGV